MRGENIKMLSESARIRRVSNILNEYYENVEEYDYDYQDIDLNEMAEFPQESVDELKQAIQEDDELREGIMDMLKNVAASVDKGIENFKAKLDGGHEDFDPDEAKTEIYQANDLFKRHKSTVDEMVNSLSEKKPLRDHLENIKNFLEEARDFYQDTRDFETDFIRDQAGQVFRSGYKTVLGAIRGGAKATKRNKFKPDMSKVRNAARAMRTYQRVLVRTSNKFQKLYKEFDEIYGDDAKQFSLE